MADLTAPLAKAQAGELTIEYLKGQFDEERVKLAEANEAYEKSDKGWMGALDLLAGDTAEAKMNDYLVRGKALEDAAALIKKDAELRAMRLATRPDDAQASVADHQEKRFAQQAPPNQFIGAHQFISPEAYHFKSMDNSPTYQKFMSLTKEERSAPEAIRANQVLAVTKASDYIPVLKANTYASSATGLLPTDAIGMPYDLWTGELRYFNIVAEAGSIVRYMQSRPESAVNFTTGDVQTRERLAALHEMDDDGDVIQAAKKSFGVWTKMAMEDLRDNGRVNERTNRQLDILMQQAMAYMILAGDNSARQWNGILRQLTTAPAANGIAGLDLTHNSVPVLSTGVNEPVAFIDRLMVELGLRGCFPNVVFLSGKDWNTIRDSQRSQALRNQGDDYTTMAPFGRVANLIPMCPTRHLPANTALLANTSKTMDVVLGSDIITGVSEDFKFDELAVSVRRAVDGQTALMMPLGMIKITATNEWEAAS